MDVVDGVELMDLPERQPVTDQQMVDALKEMGVWEKLRLLMEHGQNVLPLLSTGLCGHWFQLHVAILAAQRGLRVKLATRQNAPFDLLIERLRVQCKMTQLDGGALNLKRNGHNFNYHRSEWDVLATLRYGELVPLFIPVVHLMQEDGETVVDRVAWDAHETYRGLWAVLESGGDERVLAAAASDAGARQRRLADERTLAKLGLESADMFGAGDGSA